jgi:HK97 gp10 family phage protein
MAEGKLFDLKILGAEDIVANVERIGREMEAIAPKAIEKAAEEPMAMMRRLVPVRTGKLQKTIRFSLGFRQGAPRSSFTRTGKVRKTTVVGFIVAGDATTLVGGKAHRAKAGFGRRSAKQQQWQLARLIEFGTTSMSAQPFFFPAWRANKRKVKAIIALELRKALKAAKKSTVMAEAA